MKAYHFTDGNKLLDGRPVPPIGEWIEHDGPIVPCASGLHASEHPFDALSFAPGNMLHLVELEGDLVAHGTPVAKYVGRRRKIIATIDADPILRAFARWCAFQVIDLCIPLDVVKEYLETGDETKLDAARAAAWSADWSTAFDAARAAQKQKFAQMVDDAFAAVLKEQN